MTAAFIRAGGPLPLVSFLFLNAGEPAYFMKLSRTSQNSGDRLRISLHRVLFTSCSSVFILMVIFLRWFSQTECSTVFQSATFDKANLVASHSRFHDTRVVSTDTNYKLMNSQGL